MKVKVKMRMMTRTVGTWSTSPNRFSASFSQYALASDDVNEAGHQEFTGIMLSAVCHSNGVSYRVRIRSSHQWIRCSHPAGVDQPSNPHRTLLPAHCRPFVKVIPKIAQGAALSILSE